MNLRLYVAGGAPNSVRAIANLAAICKEQVRLAFKLEIIDVLEFPLRALADGVLVTPHLAKLSPAPAAKVIGNLSDRASVLAALEMVEGVVTATLPPAHVGIHAGPVVFQAGDYFGRTVNIAARIAEYARPGEVVVSQEVVDAAEETAVTFTEIGPVELKGVSGTLRLHSARGLD